MINSTTSIKLHPCAKEYEEAYNKSKHSPMYVMEEDKIKLYLDAMLSDLCESGMVYNRVLYL